MSGLEQHYIQEAFETNWIAPVGPHVDAFEQEFASTVETRFAVAVTSGTAAIHLGLRLAGVGQGDEVLVSTFTFIGSVAPILYLGARPVFIDSERVSWNMDPELLADTIKKKASQGKVPKAVVVVHLYGQVADIDPIARICSEYEIALIEDATEALGAKYKGRSPGGFGLCGAFSFNGNKIITTSGGGMLVTNDSAIAERARKLATQAREPAPHYEHVEIGYNYRLSNVLAGIGRAQLRVLPQRVEARRANYEYYKQALSDLPGIAFMPEAPWCYHSRWLTCITVHPDEFGSDRSAVQDALEQANIESRPLFKPMHLQPALQAFPAVGGEVAESLFNHGLCLPSGSSLTTSDLERVVEVIRSCHR